MRRVISCAACVWIGLALLGCYDLNVKPPGDAGAGDSDTDTDTDTDTDSDSDGDCDPGWAGAACDVCVRFVEISVSDGGDGLTWENAFNKVGMAIDAASSALSEESIEHCEVWVASGHFYIYQEGPGDTVQLATDVSVYGGFIGGEIERDQRDWEINRVVLDGSQQGSPTMRVHHVVLGADASVLDGFVVVSGLANSGPDDLYGGGYWIGSGSAEIHNCRFLNNYAQEGGGAIAFTGGTLTVSNTLFALNTAENVGGAINLNPGQADISDCIFAGNRATGIGAAAGALGLSGDPAAVINAIFAGNVSGDYGGAIAGTGATLTNATVIDNFAGSSGGGIYAASSTAVRNSIFWGNTPDQIDAPTPSISYSCVDGIAEDSGNISDVPMLAGYPFPLEGTWTSINYDDDNIKTVLTDSTASWGSGDLVGRLVRPDSDADSRWVYVASNTSTEIVVWGDVTDFAEPGDSYGIYDFHLNSGSPCIDSADGDVATDYDLEDNPREDDTDTPNTGVGDPNYVDMGVFEYQP